MRALDKNQMRAIIDGKGHGERIPLLFSIWMNAAPFHGDEAAYQKWISNKVCDVEEYYLNMPGFWEGPADAPEYRWAFGEKKWDDNAAIDSQVLIEDWDKAQPFYDTFPSPEYPGLVPKPETDGSRYVLARSWYTLFERHWSLRGMQNALMDFYDAPEEVHKLYQHLTDFYVRAIERAKLEMNADGFFLTDDIGAQSGPLFSLEVFREFFKPYYAQIARKAHDMGMHIWLHTCGNVTLFLEDFIEIGIDVLHPIQKYAMNAEEIAKKYGGRICILAGFDVQQVIPYGSAEEVRAEVRWLIDTYRRSDGRLMLTMGNGATEDWKVECLDALYEEALVYGRF